MKKKIISLCIIICIFILTACKSGNSKDDNLQNNDNTGKDDSAFQLNKVSKSDQDEKPITYDEANVLSFELVNRDDESYEEIIATFNVKNNNSKPVDYCTINFIYLDKDGNQICDDGRFVDCQIKSGKKSIVKSYSHINDGDKSKIANIKVASYTYTINDKVYEINLQQEKVNSWEDNSNKSFVDFDSANIVKFTLNDIGTNSIGSYEVEVKIENIGEIPIAKITYKMGYFDSEENLLNQDGRFSDSVLLPGNFVMSKSFNTDKNMASQTSAFGVYQYDYTFTDVDNNGFNHYEINLMTNKATGSLVE